MLLFVIDNICSIDSKTCNLLYSIYETIKYEVLPSPYIIISHVKHGIVNPPSQILV